MLKWTPFIFLFLVACSTPNGTKIDPLANEIERLENSLLLAMRVKGEPQSGYNILQRMEHYKVPGVSIAVIDNGKIKWAKGYGLANTNTGSQVDIQTLFQAGSISKPLAALAALDLVEQDKLDLDEDVNNYLKDWKLSENKFTEKEKVTIRRLLTHTAGTTVHGFPGYSQTDTFPNITDVLDGKGNTLKVYVDTRPGSRWRYSGGGYTVMEKVVEDVSGLPLETYMDRHFFRPLEMTNSTYQQPLGDAHGSNVSAAYDGEGKIIEGLWHNYPEQAAAGLWTTPSDLAKYCIEVQQILKGKQNGVLSNSMVIQMITKHENNWGLGPSLRLDGDSLIFGHGGKNAGFTNEMMAFAHLGQGLIVMTNADNGGKLIGEIKRGFSKHYGWGISEQKEVEVTQLSEDYLNALTGEYKLNFQVPGIGDYFIQVDKDISGIVVNDPNNGEINRLVSIDKNTFVDLDSGDKLTVKMDKDEPVLTFNGRFTFNKVEIEE